MFFCPSPSLRGSGLKYNRRRGKKGERNWSPSLRGSGLKSPRSWSPNTTMGLPLYEGVDWNFRLSLNVAAHQNVSLFTREWIEITGLSAAFWGVLSLPLYEGVDWNKICIQRDLNRFLSPSLRGSGLKSTSAITSFLRMGLPLYEGVDWNLANLVKISV